MIFILFEIKINQTGTGLKKNLNSEHFYLHLYGSSFNSHRLFLIPIPSLMIPFFRCLQLMHCTHTVIVSVS